MDFENTNMSKGQHDINDTEPYATNDIIVHLANNLNLTQKDLVEYTGLHKSQMSRIFNKKDIPTKEQLEKLSIPLKVSKETLWVIGGYMLPPSEDSEVATELKNLNTLLKSIYKERKSKQPFYEKHTNLTAKEKEFIEEYIEFVHYRKRKK